VALSSRLSRARGGIVTVGPGRGGCGAAENPGSGANPRRRAISKCVPGMSKADASARRAIQSAVRVMEQIAYAIRKGKRLLTTAYTAAGQYCRSFGADNES
jgi:hypothetical protein